MYFILGFIIVLGIILLIFKSSNNNPNQQTYSNNKYISKSNQSIENIKSNLEVYHKKIGVFQYDLKGIFYNEYKVIGDFFGYAKNTYNSHDKYSVGVFINNKLAGHIPKGNIRLHNTINKFHNNNIICWGYINYDGYHNNYNGSVFIPIGFTEEVIMNIEIALKLINIQNILFKKEDKNISEYFELLNNDNKIYELITDLKLLNTINYSFNRNIIPQLSKKLEEEKKWDKLVELEKYKSQINDLSLVFKNSTLKRIDKAKKLI